jgi:hypothetical protein
MAVEFGWMASGALFFAGSLALYRWRVRGDPDALRLGLLAVVVGATVFLPTSWPWPLVTLVIVLAAVVWAWVILRRTPDTPWTKDESRGV